MTYIIHYVLAITLSLLGLQLQKPAKVESINTFSRITEIIQSDKTTERILLNRDCILIEKDKSYNKRTTEK